MQEELILEQNKVFDITIESTNSKSGKEKMKKKVRQTKNTGSKIIATSTIKQKTIKKLKKVGVSKCQYKR